MLIRLYLAEWASLPASAPDALLARQLPAYMAAAAQAMPGWLRAPNAFPAAALDELRGVGWVGGARRGGWAAERARAWVKVTEAIPTRELQQATTL